MSASEYTARVTAASTDVAGWLDLAAKAREIGADDAVVWASVAGGLRVFVELAAMSPAQLADMLAVLIVRLSPPVRTAPDATEFLARVTAHGADTDEKGDTDAPE